MATFLKAAYRPAPQPGKRTQDLLWVATTPTAPPMDDTLPRYKEWTAEANLYVSIYVL